MNRRLISCIAVAAILAGSATVLGQEQPREANDLKHIMSQLGFDQGDYDKLMAGEIISTQLKEGSDKELAVSVAIYMPGVTIETVKKAYRLGKTMETGRDLIKYQRLSAPPSEGDFAELGFTEKELKEISKLLKVKAGSGFNLSKEEIEQFKAAAKELKGHNPRRDPEVRQTVNETMRAMLLARVRAYQKGGVEAIAAYARGGSKTADPGKELALAIKEDSILPDHLKEFEQAFANYPNDGIEGITNVFFWVKETVQKRPTFVLSHRMMLSRPDALLGAERQFYVGHDYNSLHIIGGAVPHADGIVVFYRNRTSTDQVAGFGSGMKKGIGRGQMKDSIVKHFEELREMLKKASS